MLDLVLENRVRGESRNKLWQLCHFYLFESYVFYISGVNRERKGERDY